MIRHVVLARWRPEVDADRRTDAIAAIRRMPEHVAELRSFVVEENAGSDAGSYDVAIMAEFDDLGGYAAYRDHPEHQALIRDVTSQVLQDRASLQVQLP